VLLPTFSLHMKNGLTFIKITVVEQVFYKFIKIRQFLAGNL
jgi:hypothetical protein